MTETRWWTDEDVEKAARALYDWHQAGMPPWERAPASHEHYRSQARAVLSSVSAVPREQLSGGVKAQSETETSIWPLWAVTLSDIGVQYLTADSAAQATVNAGWIWPNNPVLSVEEVSDG